MNSKSYQIIINGRVQGVGFRPFVYNLAQNLDINGTILNNAFGVIIQLTTTSDKLQEFIHNLNINCPKVAHITTLQHKEVPLVTYSKFEIIPSEQGVNIDLPLTPDFAICASCQDEIRDKKNPRNQYPFTTCVHCGPRFSITKSFPFDRNNTSLEKFKMCPECDAEYQHPSDKRFHSQTNSCSNCGVKLWLENNQGETIHKEQNSILNQVALLISTGNILAIKNNSGYILCCDATNTESIDKLRRRKKRSAKPFAVIYPSLSSAKDDFEISELEADELTSSIAPIVLLKNKITTNIRTQVIAPNLDQTGVMLPSSALLTLLLDILKKPIIATSGNIHGSPILSEEEEARKLLNPIADYFLHNNLDIHFPQDDSVVRFANEYRIILRRSRGFAPNYFIQPSKKTLPTLAMGAHLKSTFTYVPNHHVYVSPYFGNLDNYNVSQRYQNTIDQFIELFGTRPKTLLIDKHPQYQSSTIGHSLAEKYNGEIIEMQHHKAHLFSVLGEHNLLNNRDKIMGVIWDGTGLGDDNQIWGGDFFDYQNHTVRRFTHFQYFDWIANDKMAKEPRLALFSLLEETSRSLIRHKFNDTEWTIYNKTISNNTLKTSSVGRIFDAMASALDLVDINNYEAEAAMILENCANKSMNSKPIDYLMNNDQEPIASQILILTALEDYRRGSSQSDVAKNFIYTLSRSIFRIANNNNYKMVACSGGVFQNAMLVEMLLGAAKGEGVHIYLNKDLSPNDENISFGQWIGCVELD